MTRSHSEAQERLDRTLTQSRMELSVKLESIGQSVEGRLNENLREGYRHFEKVQEHLAAAELKLASLGAVGQSISDLNALLRLPHLRGGFGEATLERLLADFLPTGAYELQYAVTPGSAERVDAIVRFSRQVLPIDSKFPREQVLPLFERAEGPALAEARAKLAELIKNQARSIAEKYIRPEHGTMDMALLFLPSETLYFEVIRDGRLFEHLNKLKIFPVSPNTLAISLRSVAMAHEYYDLARGVERTIGDVKKARRHFGHFERKFDDIGKGLRKAQEAFETAHTHLGHYESSIHRLVGAEPGDEAVGEGEPLPVPPGQV